MKTVSDLATRWLNRQPDKLSELESRVLRSAVDRKPVSRNTNETFARAQALGDQIADAVARIGGSWSFILGFIAFLILWTVANAWLLGMDQFDPYPFVFLNLVLSMVAALQAPVIMMSQNRQAERDRLAASHDYEVNLKAEIEIMALHEKLDELRHQEIIAIHQQISEIAASIKRIDERWSGGKTTE
jgi:uncharacterized membrane protein